MKKISKKILALVMSLAVALTMIPGVVMATENDADNEMAPELVTYKICAKEGKKYVENYTGDWGDTVRYYVCKTDGGNNTPLESTEYQSISWSSSEDDGYLAFGSKRNNYADVIFAVPGKAELTATVKLSGGNNVPVKANFTIEFDEEELFEDFDLDEIFNEALTNKKLEVNKTVTVDNDTAKNEWLDPFDCYAFKPDSTEIYDFNVSGTENLKAFIFDGDGNLVKYNSADGKSLKLRCKLAEAHEYYLIAGPADYANEDTFTITVAENPSSTAIKSASVKVYNKSGQMVSAKSVNFEANAGQAVITTEAQKSIGKIELTYKTSSGTKTDTVFNYEGEDFDYNSYKFNVVASTGDKAQYTLSFIKEKTNNLFINVDVIGHRSEYRSYNEISFTEFDKLYSGKTSATIKVSVPFDDYYNGVEFELTENGGTRITSGATVLDNGAKGFTLTTSGTKTIKVTDPSGKTKSFKFALTKQSGTGVDTIEMKCTDTSAGAKETGYISGSALSTSKKNPTVVYLPKWYTSGDKVDLSLEALASQYLDLYTGNTKEGSKAYVEKKLAAYTPTDEGLVLMVKTYNSKSKTTNKYYLKFVAGSNNIAELYGIRVNYSDGAENTGTKKIDLTEAASENGAVCIIPEGVSFKGDSDDFVEIQAVPMGFGAVEGGENIDVIDMNVSTDYVAIPIKVVSRDSSKSKEYLVTLVNGNKGDLSKAGIILENTEVTYNGSEQKPGVEVTLGGKTLEKDKDYSIEYRNNKEVGKATVVVSGKGAKGLNEDKYFGTVTKNFTINAIDIEKADVKGIPETSVYTGKAQKPVPVVTLDKELVSGTDYTVTYGANKSVGQGTVTITGKGNYAGTINATFKIVPKGTTISSATSSKAKTIAIKWKKQATQTKGYVIEYSKDPTFTAGVSKVTVSKNSTTSKSITTEDSGVYYVRIMTYKTVSSKNYYSAPSEVKEVTVQ